MTDIKPENRCREAYDTEPAEDYAYQAYDSHDEQFAFVAGAKWQAGRATESIPRPDLQAVREALESELEQPPYEGLDYRSGIRKALSLLAEPEQPKADGGDVVERIRVLLAHCRPAHVTHHIEVLLAALTPQDAQPASGIGVWQPIETAPKDGTTIVLACSRGADYPCCWRNDAWRMWGIDVFDGMAWVPIDYTPTHWMLLPKLPAAPALHSKGAGV